MSNLGQCHSFNGMDSLKDIQHSEAIRKSDVNISADAGVKIGDPKYVSRCCSSYGDVIGYNKKYEYDVIPVRENSKMVNPAFHEIEAGDSGKISLTNSELDKLEDKIYNTISKELQRDHTSINSLQSNIQIFKTKFLEIFDNFYASMRDIESYKSRFEEILSKNKVDAVREMESLIENIYGQILSSDSNMIEEDRISAENPTTEIEDKGNITGVHLTTSNSNNRQTVKLLESLHSIVKEYKSVIYQYDCPLENASLNTITKKEEILNIYMQGGAPYLHITLNGRNLLSETDIRPNSEKEQRPIASAENLKKIASKKQHSEYEYGGDRSLSPDREIPVKASFARKNICLDEELRDVREKDENVSFISKICNYICKKLRRN